MKHARVPVLALLVALALTAGAVVAADLPATDDAPAVAPAAELETSQLDQQATEQLIAELSADRGATAVSAISCEQQCRRDYYQCLIVCSKNPCFVACETVLEICLDNC